MITYLEDIRDTEWGIQTIFKINKVNELNETIGYHLLNDERRRSARFSEVDLLYETKVPDGTKYENTTNEISISHQ